MTFEQFKRYTNRMIAVAIVIAVVVILALRFTP